MWLFGCQCGEKAYGRPKWKLRRGGLDIRAEGRHVEVQKRSQDIEDWTLKWREGTRKSKKRSRDVTYWMLELSEGTKKSKGKQTQEPSKQAA